MKIPEGVEDRRESPKKDGFLRRRILSLIPRFQSKNTDSLPILSIIDLIFNLGLGPVTFWIKK